LVFATSRELDALSQPLVMCVMARLLHEGFNAVPDEGFIPLNEEGLQCHPK
jgi:hypothetical protein